MKTPIDKETEKRAIQLYKKGDLKIAEISNLLDISIPKLYAIFREYRAKGLLTAKQGTNANRRKFTPEQEKQIAIDYYVNDLSHTEIQKKYNAHPMQIQRIRNQYAPIYGQKQSRSPIKHRDGQNRAI